MIEENRQRAVELLSGPGDWYSGAARMAAWREVRDAADNELDHARKLALTPFGVDGAHVANEELNATEVDVVHRVASDSGRLSRAWADGVIEEISEERYTELVGLAACFAALDTFDRVMGREPTPIPEPTGGEPTRRRPDGMGDVGAWVSQTDGPSMANVSRAISLVPETDTAWRGIVLSHYSRDGFDDLSWERALSRPQVELIAARTTAHLECFY